MWLIVNVLLMNFGNFIVLTAGFIFYFGSSFIFANTNSIAFTPFGHIAGAAAGLYGFLQLSGGAVMSYLIALFELNLPEYLGFMFLISGGLALISFKIIASPKLSKK